MMLANMPNKNVIACSLGNTLFLGEHRRGLVRATVIDVGLRALSAGFYDSISTLVQPPGGVKP